MAVSGLTPRQEIAQRLTRELQALGATITNSLPLADGVNLRFWVTDSEKGQILQALKDAGYVPTFIGTGPQVDIRSYGMRWVNNFELPLPADRQPVADDQQTVYGEIARPEKTDVELEGIRKYLGWPPPEKKRQR